MRLRAATSSWRARFTATWTPRWVYQRHPSVFLLCWLGCFADLFTLFSLFPLRQMMWYQNSFLLDPTDRRMMYTKGDRYVLNVTNFHTTDFGNYRWVSPGEWSGWKLITETSATLHLRLIGRKALPTSQFIRFFLSELTRKKEREKKSLERIYALSIDLIICQAIRSMAAQKRIWIIRSIDPNFYQFHQSTDAALRRRLLIMLIYSTSLLSLFMCHGLFTSSCVADNSLGRTKKYIEVSGRPGPAEFLSPTYSGHLDRYNLTFKIESIPLLEEIKLLYRKLMVMRRENVCLSALSC